MHFMMIKKQRLILSTLVVSDFAIGYRDSLFKNIDVKKPTSLLLLVGLSTGLFKIRRFL
jgi:hypothetical protein